MMESILPGLKSAVNLHPMMVHFPIAFWAAATVLWSLSVLRRREDLWTFGLWLHTAGAIAGIVALALGYLGTSIMGHDAPGHDLVHVHRDIMKVAVILSVVLTAGAWWKRSELRILRIGLLVVSGIQAIIMTLGADRGAVLVYQHGTGVDIESQPETHEMSPTTPHSH